MGSLKTWEYPGPGWPADAGGHHVPSLTLTAGLRVPMRDPWQRRLSGHGLAALGGGCGP